MAHMEYCVIIGCPSIESSFEQSGLAQLSACTADVGCSQNYGPLWLQIMLRHLIDIQGNKNGTQFCELPTWL